MLIKISMVTALLAAAPAFAETVAPFPADDCNPGFTAAGEFINGAGAVLPQTGWVAKATNVVVTAEGQRVFLSEACLQAYLADRGNADEAGQGGSNLAALGGGLVAAVVAGLSGGTNGTNGTN